MIWGYHHFRRPSYLIIYHFSREHVGTCGIWHSKHTKNSHVYDVFTSKSELSQQTSRFEQQRCVDPATQTWEHRGGLAQQLLDLAMNISDDAPFTDDIPNKTSVYIWDFPLPCLIDGGYMMCLTSFCINCNQCGCPSLINTYWYPYFSVMGWRFRPSRSRTHFLVKTCAVHICWLDSPSKCQFVFVKSAKSTVFVVKSC